MTAEVKHLMEPDLCFIKLIMVWGIYNGCHLILIIHVQQYPSLPLEIAVSGFMRIHS